jgi:tetratricopeptide (TPR) repeat protein
VAETVARHLVATGQLIDDDPQEALAHALAARRLASRIAAVREAVGLAAYHAGEWQTAIAELRTYHRMSGRQTHLAVLADCERALGRPERAIDLFRGANRESMDPAEAIELLIVAAGARGDLGQGDAAVAMLQVRELTAAADEPWAARLRYAYADSLLAVGRREEAREWFARAADADEAAETDAAERLLELDGVVLEGDDEDVEVEDRADGADAEDEDRADAEDEDRADAEDEDRADAEDEDRADAEVEDRADAEVEDRADAEDEVEDPAGGEEAEDVQDGEDEVEDVDDGAGEVGAPRRSASTGPEPTPPAGDEHSESLTDTGDAEDAAGESGQPEARRPDGS